MNSQQTIIMEEFHKLCIKIRSGEDTYSEEVESLYAELLDFLENNPSARPELAETLKSAVRHFRNARREGPGILSIDAISYCMHELRWEEILQVALEEHRDYFVPRRESTLVRLIEAFEDDWSEAESYKRYSDPT